MKTILGEYGKIVVSITVGIIVLAILFSTGTILTIINGLKPENTQLSDGQSYQVIQELSASGIPVLDVRDMTIPLGQSIKVSELVVSATQNDHSDLKDQIIYTLEDGTEIAEDYLIVADSIKIHKIIFYLQNASGLSVQREALVKVDVNSSIPEVSKLLKSWDIGQTEDQVNANLYETQDESILLSIEGSGKCKSFSIASIPWISYMDKINACFISDTVTINSMDGWFFHAVNLEELPLFPNTIESLRYTFAGCTSLTAGFIPSSAQDIEGIYQDCANLERVNALPYEIINCKYAFLNCKKLHGDLRIEATPYEYEGCFWNTAWDTQNIYLKLFPSIHRDNRSIIIELTDSARLKNEDSKIAIGERKT